MATVATRHASALIAGALALAALSGCGSTRSLGSLPSSQQAGDGLSVAAPTVPNDGGSTSAPSSESLGTVAIGSGGDPGAGYVAPNSSADGPRTASGTSLRATYRGVSASSIAVGLSAVAPGSSNSVVGSQGVTGYSQSPEEQIQRALISYVNKHGGVNGRSLTPVFQYYNPNDSAPYDQQSQATCTALTEDKKVFAHLAIVSDLTFSACMEKHGTVGVETTEPGSAQASALAPGVFYPGDLNLTALSALEADAFSVNGFFTKSSKIGVIQSDTADLDSARVHGLEAGLARHRLALSQVYRITPVNSNSDAALAIRDMLAAVLKFKSSGIDRVVFLIDRGGASGPLQFMSDAEQQGYHPRYGLTTHDGPVALTGGNAPAAQLVGSVGVGFHPEQDVNVPAQGQVSPAAANCIAILRQAKITLADAGQRGGALKYCEAVFFFVTVAKAAGTELTRSSFIRAGQSLGTAFSDPFNLKGAVLFAGAPNDGVNLWQSMSYVQACSCFRSSGAPTSLR